MTLKDLALPLLLWIFIPLQPEAYCFEQKEITANQWIEVGQDTTPFLLVLGTAQDAGSPQAGCQKPCCAALHAKPDQLRKVVSLGLIDPVMDQRWLFEATPDFPAQLEHLMNYPGSIKTLPDGIFVTHAHIGHYTGLMYLGKEVMDTRNVKVYGLPRLCRFLENNGPWDQLIKRQNIEVKAMTPQRSEKLSSQTEVVAITVPHRDEYSETAAFLIKGPTKTALFIPDIDKWSKWDQDIRDLVKQVDYALIDATFYDGNELPGRNMDEIPHPFVTESMSLFSSLPEKERNKVIFIHFNHTNPLWHSDHPASRTVLANGFRIAFTGMKLGL